MDIVKYTKELMEWSYEVHGPGERTMGLVEHIRKELDEITEEPHDVYEWVDVVILALNGACRHGYTPEEVATALSVKLQINKNRQWPDWKEAGQDKPLQHVKS